MTEPAVDGQRLAAAVQAVSREDKTAPLADRLSEIAALLGATPQAATAVQELQAAVNKAADDGRRVSPQNLRLRVLLGLATTMRSLKRDDEARKLYNAARVVAPGHPQPLIGLGHMARAGGEYQQSLEHFEKALQLRPGDPALREEVARSLFNLNRLAEAADAYQSLLRDQPAAPGALLGLALVRRYQGQADAARALVRASAAVEAPPGLLLQIETQLRYYAFFDDAHQILERALAQKPDSDAIMLRFAVAARLRGDHEVALEWFTKAAAIEPKVPSRLFEVATTLSDLGRHDEAARILADIQSNSEWACDEQLRTAQLESLCRQMKYDEARAALASFGEIASLPNATVLWAVSLYVATGAWAELLHLFKTRIVPGRGAGLVSSSSGLIEGLGNMARALGNYVEVIELSKNWAQGVTPPVAALREHLVEELEWLRGLGWIDAGLADQTAPDRAARSASIVQSLRPHLNGGARVVQSSPAPSAGGEGVVYFCSDHAYLPGAIVALASALRHNRAALADCRLCIFLSDDAYAVGLPMLERLAAAYGIDIEAVPVAQLGFRTTGFKTDWGFFALGHKLSDAAYYRIVAALWLAEQPYPRRALYIDSDVCVGPGLAGLLQFDLGGKPLAARLDEAELPAIWQGARKLGLDPLTYFNSGVMVVDLQNPEAVPALLQALHIAYTEPERLSFVDQCALNLAFSGKVAYLPPVFNAFLRQHGHPSLLPANPVVLHYLGRPKPWDPAYPVANGARWIDEYLALAEILEPEQLRYLLSIQFGSLLKPSGKDTATDGAA